MKRFLRFTVALALMILPFLVRANASDEESRPFITTWQVKRGETIALPFVGTYKLMIINSSGEAIVQEELQKGTFYFNPPNDGYFTIKAGPEGLERFCMGDTNGITRDALSEVVDFGTVAWTSMQNTFAYCTKMVFDDGVRAPDLSNVTDMSKMFYQCGAFNQPIQDWDVSNVTDMSNMFYNCSTFNQPLAEWDVSRVTNMKEMFSGARAFSMPLRAWKTSNVTTMERMFEGCKSFTQPIEDWDVSNVTDMNYMFHDCTAFNQPLEKWNVGQVEKMYFMFSGCTVFNQRLEKWKLRDGADTENMFIGCKALGQKPSWYK